MRRAVQVLTIGFAAQLAFQAALAAGAPLGDAAWGGAHTQLTTGQRAASAIAMVFWFAAITVVRGRAAGRLERRYRWGTWGLVVVLGISALMNLASGSRWENLVLAPVAMLLAGLCVFVARGGRRPGVPAHQGDDRPSAHNASAPTG